MTAAAVGASPDSAPGSGTGTASGSPVELVDLCRSFGATRALDHLSLTVAPGELVALLGPSGCGKTTALRVLAGFETADSGRVVVQGREISRVPAQRRDMGMVFQSYSLFPNLNARDNVAFGLRMRGRKSADRRAQAAEMLELVGLASQADQYPHQLSGGQQQRVALARALAIEPSVLLLDEPLSALDAKVRLQLRDQIRALQTRLGTTTLFVTHDQEEALSMADRVGVMQSGRIEQIDTPSALYENPGSPFVAEFVGLMNRLPGTVDGAGAAVLGRVLPIRNQHRFPLGTSVDVLVRPEGLGLTPAEDGRHEVVAKTFLGSLTRVSVAVDGRMVLVDQPSETAARLVPGHRVDVAVVGATVLVADSTPPAAVPAAATVAADPS
ncbi:MAG TPA: ABC transporter ATP-binding protein [Acidimicrobiales bacterium]|nr:ABC transporter ATP-binding protein [Acidimicrobiales bacterium]